MFIVYILFRHSLKKYYVGQTNDLDKRMHYHNSGQSKYTSKGIPWVLIHKEEKSNRSEVVQLETKIKNRGIFRYLQGIGVT
jgi:putative endonuclease